MPELSNTMKMESPPKYKTNRVEPGCSLEKQATFREVVKG